MWMDTHPKRRQEQANNSLFIIYRKHWKKSKIAWTFLSRLYEIFARETDDFDFDLE